MVLTEVVEQAGKETIDRIRELSKSTMPEPISIDFRFDWFRDEDRIAVFCRELSSKSMDFPSLYVISPINPIQTEQLAKSFLDTKTNRPAGPYSKYNNDAASGRPQDIILYVGSTRKRLGTRIRQHIGPQDNSTTYALCLRDWLPQDTQGIRLKYWVFRDSIIQSNLQFVEDSVWDYLHPLFGKRGAH